MVEQPLIPLSAITWVGSDLKRPECVLTTAKGEVFAGDHEAGIVEVGKPKRTLVGAPPGFVPNGVAMRVDRQFLIANLGPGGGVWRLDHEWRLWPELFEVEGEALRVCNFVGLDADHTEWISVSTRQYPREQAMKPDFGDGFIVRRDKHGARIVAGGLAYTNECHVDPSGQWLWVNETFGRRITPLCRSPSTALASVKSCTSSAPASSPTVSPSTPRARPGSPASSPTASSGSRPTAGAP